MSVFLLVEIILEQEDYKVNYKILFLQIFDSRYTTKIIFHAQDKSRMEYIFHLNLCPDIHSLSDKLFCTYTSIFQCSTLDEDAVLRCGTNLSSVEVEHFGH